MEYCPQPSTLTIKSIPRQGYIFSGFRFRFRFGSGLSRVDTFLTLCVTLPQARRHRRTFSLFLKKDFSHCSHWVEITGEHKYAAFFHFLPFSFPLRNTLHPICPRLWLFHGSRGVRRGGEWGCSCVNATLTVVTIQPLLETAYKQQQRVKKKEEKKRCLQRQ